MAEQIKSYTPTHLEEILERNEREFSAFKKLNPAEQAKYQAQMYLHYASTPWSFLRDCVYTLNQVSQDVKAIQPYPGYLEYLQFLTALFLKEPLLAIPKSRRMFCSWNKVSLYTHDTIFREGRFNGFVSKKEEDAGELVARAEFIYRNIPEWRIPRALLPKLKNDRMTQDPPVLEFPEINSKIQGFPQGADQLRQFTLSGILGDECAFWEQAQKFYSASKPTIDGGGRMTLISSRSPGFFKKIVFDKLDALDLNFREVPPVEPLRPMEGVKVWRNPGNKFVVVDLHYTADPRKRGQKWREAVKSSMPSRDFAMEYEDSWLTYSENPVFQDFNKALHVKTGKIQVEAHLPLLIAFSFGLTPSCLIAQLVGRSLKIRKEFQEKGSVQKLATMVWNYLSLEFSGWIAKEDMAHVWADPEGFEKKENDQFSRVQTLKKAGFNRIRPGETIWENRKKATEDFMTKTYAEGPALIVSDDCPLTIEALAGGYRYKESTTEEEQANTVPVRDKYMRVAECVNYLCAAVSKQNRAVIKMSTPSYGFQK
jgi:hypothetical protein